MIERLYGDSGISVNDSDEADGTTAETRNHAVIRVTCIWYQTMQQYLYHVYTEIHSLSCAV